MKGRTINLDTRKASLMASISMHKEELKKLREEVKVINQMLGYLDDEAPKKAETIEEKASVAPQNGYAEKYDSFKALLLDILKNENLSSAKLAKQTKLNAVSLSNWKNGQNIPCKSKRNTVAMALSKVCKNRVPKEEILRVLNKAN